jgi:nitrite reductase/ring-hydroxylating ferredoxin subunit/uncharacterized membrane protein
MGLHELTTRLEKIDALDRPGRAVAGAVSRVLPPGPVKDLLSGTWLGHTLHPVLTDLPIGTLTSAMLLDLLGGEDTDRAAELLIGVGLVSSLPTAAAGLSDWTDTIAGERRLGFVHASSNTVALALYSGSWLARRRGNRRLGVALGFAGGAATLVGAYLGGHLSLTKGVGVDQTAFETGPRDWTAVLGEDELTDGELRRVDVEGTAVLLFKRGAEIRALSNRCSHLGCPLDEGQVHDGRVTCPCHGSTFRLDDGAVVRGPARTPQPVYEVRIEDGKLEVRRAHH